MVKVGENLRAATYLRLAYLTQQAPKGQTDVTAGLRVPCACCRLDLQAHECHRPRMSSPASPPPPPSRSHPVRRIGTDSVDNSDVIMHVSHKQHTLGQL